MAGRLAGKVALITGAGGGQGRAAAVLFAAEGAKVVVADVKTEGGAETAQLVKDAGGQAVFCAADVSQAAQRRVCGAMRQAVSSELSVLSDQLSAGLSRSEAKELYALHYDSADR